MDERPEVHCACLCASRWSTACSGERRGLMEKTTVSRTGLTFMGTGGAWERPRSTDARVKICQNHGSTRPIPASFRSLMARVGDASFWTAARICAGSSGITGFPSPMRCFLSPRARGPFLGAWMNCFRSGVVSRKKSFSLIPLYATEETFNAVETRFGYLIGSVSRKELFIRENRPAGLRPPSFL